jgi:hypothetical protein
MPCLSEILIAEQLDSVSIRLESIPSCQIFGREFLFWHSELTYIMQYWPLITFDMRELNITLY